MANPGVPYFLILKSDYNTSKEQQPVMEGIKQSLIQGYFI
jgi:hypothetical protein